MSSSSTVTYPRPSFIPHGPRPRDRGQRAEPPEYANLNAHGSEVLRVRGISPDVASERGYRSWTASDAEAAGFVGEHARVALAIPNFNVTSEFDDYQTRPHDPVTDPKTGEKRKYLWRIGHTPELAGPPAATPAARDRADQLRDNLQVPVVVVESILKLDSVLSHADRDLYPIAIHGNWGWTVNGAPTPALRGIPWRRKRHGKVVHRRDTILMPDSDYWTKQEVAQGWWEFGKDLERRQARVLVARVPAGPNGQKWGPDDALAAGATTVEELIASATPLPRLMPIAGTTAVNADETLSDLECTQRKLAEAEATIANLVALALNPHITPTDKITLISAGEQVQKMAERGKVESIGSSYISQDFRSTRRPKGTPKPDINPTSGTKPLMERSSVKPAMARAMELGWVVATPVMGEITRANGTKYPDQQWLIEPQASLGAFLAPAATYVPEQIKTRTPYGTGKTCVHCGDVHDRTHITYCGEITADGEIVSGCAGVVGRRVERVPLASRRDITDEQREHLDRITRTKTTDPTQIKRDQRKSTGGMSEKNPDIQSPVNVPSPSAPSSPVNCQEKILTSPIPEPDFLGESPPEPAFANVVEPGDGMLWRPSTSNLCTTPGCTNEIPAHRKYICDECADQMAAVS